MFWEIIIALAVPYLVAAINGVATQTTVKTWYPTLQRPWFRPPNWLFAPAWTVFYTLMGLASHVAYTAGASTGLWIYGVQLALNAVWSPVFFWQKSISGGLAVMTALVIAAAVTCGFFFAVSSTAGLLFFPYVLWLGYAWTLNAYIWRHNPDE